MNVKEAIVVHGTWFDPLLLQAMSLPNSEKRRWRRWHCDINILCGWPSSLALFTDKFFSGALPEADYIKKTLSQWQCATFQIYICGRCACGWHLYHWPDSTLLTRTHCHPPSALYCSPTQKLLYNCFTQTISDTLTALKKRTLLLFPHFRLSSKISYSKHLAMPTKWYWQFPMLS